MRSKQDDFHHSVVSKNRFLDVYPVQFYSEKLNAGVERKLELDTLVGRVSHLVVMIRKAGNANSNSNDGQSQYLSLGPQGRIDVLDPGSRSVWGSGTPLDAEFIRNEIYASHC